jgi:hypothetical protein
MGVRLPAGVDRGVPDLSVEARQRTAEDDARMKSFRLEKVRGDQDVTHEALLWLAVYVFIVAPVLWLFWLLSARASPWSRSLGSLGS